MHALARADEVDGVPRREAGVDGAGATFVEHVVGAVAVALEQRPAFPLVKIGDQVLDRVAVAAERFQDGAQFVAWMIELGVGLEEDAQIS